MGFSVGVLGGARNWCSSFVRFEFFEALSLNCRCLWYYDRLGNVNIAGAGGSAAVVVVVACVVGAAAGVVFVTEGSLHRIAVNLFLLCLVSQGTCFCGDRPPP